MHRKIRVDSNFSGGCLGVPEGLSATVSDTAQP